MRTVNYSLTVADVIDARGYAYNSLPLVRAIRLILFIATLGCLLLGAYRAFQRDWNGMATLGGWFSIGLALVVWMGVGNWLLLPTVARKQLARSKGLQGHHTVSWDAERIEFEASHGQSRWPWSDFYQWKESPGGFLLWPSDGTYFYLPKRVLADNQVSEIRTNLTSAAGAPGKPRK